MNKEHRTYRAFTLIELVVTIAILAMMISFTSVIFSVSIEAQRVAEANTEIMQKLRAITNQLNADFKGLRMDGEIFVVWQVVKGNISAENERFDRIIFFANGDFHSYHPDANTVNIIHGNIARISYMLARNSYIPGQGSPVQQQPHERILARTQHILTADTGLPETNFSSFSEESQWYDWRDELEYDRMTMQEWTQMSWPLKSDILTVLTDFGLSNIRSTLPVEGGVTIEPNNPDLYQMILCERVGEFQVQGWYDLERRWVPDSNPDGIAFTEDSDFVEVAGEQRGFLLYPYLNQPLRGVFLGGSINSSANNYYRDVLNEQNFNEIPGLGRALRFTFTLYDSRGIFENGRTFTHIVYLDN